MNNGPERLWFYAHSEHHVVNVAKLTDGRIVRYQGCTSQGKESGDVFYPRKNGWRYLGEGRVSIIETMIQRYQMEKR